MYIYRIYIRQFRKNTGRSDPGVGQPAKQWSHHSTGVFCNQSQWTAFEFKEEDETFRSNILRIDARFVNLIKWLGENRINVLLSGENRADGYAVYKIRENAFHGGTKLSAADGFYSM